MISVVIPCRNEVKNIQECIEAISASVFTKPTEIEILVIDGQSDDGTIKLLNNLKTDHPNLRIVENEKRVTPVAFNLGIKEAEGEYIQIIGARQVISIDYLEKAKKSIEDNPDIWCVGGGVENVFQSEESKNIGLAMSSPFGVGGGNFRILKESGFCDTVGTPMYPKEVFDKIGYFDECLVRNQDDDFNYRVTKAGGKIFLNADIKIKYYVRAKISNLFKQYYQYGYWKVFVNRKHKTVTTLRQLVPIMFLLSFPLAIAFVLVSPALWFAPLVAYLTYLLLALFFASKVAENSKGVFPISRIFMILHLSYGYGYFVGVLHFLLLRKNPSTNSQTLSR